MYVMVNERVLKCNGTVYKLLADKQRYDANRDAERELTNKIDNEYEVESNDV